MALEALVAQIRDALNDAGLPVNFDDKDSKGVGIDVREITRTVYDPKYKRKKVAIGSTGAGFLSIVYNPPFDGKGHVITYGSDHLFKDTVKVLEKLGVKFCKGDYGLIVNP